MDILAGLPMMAGALTRQISAENPTGEKGGACRWAPDPTNPDIPYSKHSVDLGKGWKVRPFVPVEAGEGQSLHSAESRRKRHADGCGWPRCHYLFLDCNRSQLHERAGGSGQHIIRFSQTLQ